MEAFNTINELNLKLIQEYLDGPPCLEFEESMIETLFAAQEYSIILNCLAPESNSLFTATRRFEITPKIIDLIIESGELSLYQCLFGMGKLELSHHLLQKVTELGKLDTLIWLHELPITKDIQNLYMLAATSGHLHILEWLSNNGYPCQDWVDEYTCSHVALVGNLPILQWLVNHQCSIDFQTCAAAICFGHLPIVQWCRDNGIQLDNRYLDLARRCKQDHIVDWINSLNINP